jgi:6-phosphogluconolactonase
MIKSSRRRFLAGTAAITPLLAHSSTPNKILAYVGTYSSPQGPEGSKGRGQGIYLFELDRTTGILSQRDVFVDAANPSWLAFNPARTCLYAANETGTYEEKNSGSVSAFRIDRSNGRLSLLNTVSSEGAGPAHLSVHPSGRYVFVANYAGGTIAVLPASSTGELGRPTDIKKDQGEPGAAKASSAPPGSFAISGHDRPHAHMIQSDPSGRFVLHSDLALDEIFIWRFDADKGTLSPNDPPDIRFPSGDGPRHFAFHPNGRLLYSLQEEASTIMAFDWDAKNGGAKPKQTISTLPEGFAGTNFTSEIMISVDRRFLYAANRLHDTIARFSIEPSGDLRYLGEEWTRGDYPRSFNTDPSGEFLFTCNQRGDAIATFAVNQSTGALAFTGRYTAVGTPAIIVFLV